jgi:competence protein ComEA
MTSRGAVRRAREPAGRSRPRGLRRVLLLAAWLVLPGAAAAERGPPDPATGLVREEGVEWVREDRNDGDSFAVRFTDGRRERLRLYFVDSPEGRTTSETLLRRLRAQRRYFGISDYGGSTDSSTRLALEFAGRASRFSRDHLGDPFTVFTAYTRDQNDRIYAFVRTAGGEDLGALLVRAGLARNYGVGHTTPEGISIEEEKKRLADLELAAAAAGRGLWESTDWSKLPAERREERREAAEIEAMREASTTLGPGVVLDPNEAGLEELERLPGVGPVRARAILEARAHRPFRSVGELRRVPGIGPVTLERMAPYLRVEGETGREG